MADINVTLDDASDIVARFDQLEFKAHSDKHESGGSDQILLQNLAISGALDLDGEDIVDGGTTLYDASTGTFGSSVFESITLNAGDGISGGGSVSPGGSLTFDIANNGVELRELDEGIAPTWTANHIFNGGLELGSTLDASGNSLINLPEPTADSHATRKQYVDAVAQGLAIKDPVEAATASDIDLSSSSDPNPIDGHSLVDGERVLLRAQSDNTQNGIYVATTATDPTTWTRASDFDESAEVTEGAFVFVENGSTNGNASFVLTSDDPHTVGSSAITFSVFSRAGDLQAGTGIDKVGQTFSVDQSFTPTWTGQHTFDSGLSVPDDTNISFGDTDDGSIFWDNSNGRLILGDDDNGTILSFDNGRMLVGGDGPNLFLTPTEFRNTLTMDDGTSIATSGSGSGAITIRDSANSQDLAVFNEGGSIDYSGSNITGINKYRVDTNWEWENTAGNATIATIDRSNDRFSFNQGLAIRDTIQITVSDLNGSVSLFDRGVSGSPSNGQDVSYSFDIDGTSVATVYAEADGAGGIQNQSFVITDSGSTSSPSLKIANSGVYADLSDRFTIVSNGVDVARFDDAVGATFFNGVTMSDGTISGIGSLNGGNSGFTIRTTSDDTFVNQRSVDIQTHTSSGYQTALSFEGDDSYTSPHMIVNDGVPFRTEGGGSDSITIRDSANSQDLAVFNEGGPVSFPNTDVEALSGNFTVDFGGAFEVGPDGAGVFGTGGGGVVFKSPNNKPIEVSNGSADYLILGGDNGAGTSGSIGLGADFAIFDENNNNNFVIFDTTTHDITFPNYNISWGEDRGAITGLDMDVTSTPTAGTQQSYSFDIDGNEIAKVFAEADGTGGIQNETFDLNAELRFLGTDRISANGTDRINFGGGFITLLTGGSGSDIVNIKDTANGQDLAVFNEGGTVEISNGDLDVVSGSVTVYDDIYFLNGGNYLRSGGSGSDTIGIWDTANGQPLFKANEGGPVEIPNTPLTFGTSQDFSIENDESSSELLISDSNGVELIRQPKAGATQFLQGIDAGSIEAPEDSFTQLVNSSVTSALTAGQRVGYTFALDNQTMMSVEGEADGSGGIQNTSTIISDGSQDLAVFNEGGNVSIPNGEIRDVQGFRTDPANGAWVFRYNNGGATDQIIRFQNGDDASIPLEIYKNRVQLVDHPLDMGGNSLRGLRSSSTALASGDLANGEVAMDEANGRMVWKDDSGSAYYVDGTAL